MKEPKSLHNTNCNHEHHSEHLCYLMFEGFHLSHKAEYRSLIEHPRYRCRKCARTVKHAENVCEPVRIDQS